MIKEIYSSAKLHEKGKKGTKGYRKIMSCLSKNLCKLDSANEITEILILSRRAWSSLYIFTSKYAD